MTYRFRAHSMFDPELYRDRAEVERWKLRDPISASCSSRSRDGAVSEDDVAALERDVAREVDEAVAFAEAGTFEPVETLLRDVTTPREAARHERNEHPIPIPTNGAGAAGTAAAPAVTHMTYRDAVRAALREALQKDARVFLMGEDVGRYGGSYACSKGLLEEFGPASASATRRSRSRPSSAPGSARRSPACGRSSRS